MWHKTGAILLVLGLLGAFGLGYMPTPMMNDAAEYASFELARQFALSVLFAAWGATMLYWRLRFHQQTWQVQTGTVLAAVGLFLALALDFHPAPIQVLGYVSGASQYEIGRQYGLPIYYHILAASAFSFLVVGITLACWKNAERRTASIETLSSEASAIADEQATTHVEQSAGSPSASVRVSHKRARQRV